MYKRCRIDAVSYSNRLSMRWNSTRPRPVVRRWYLSASFVFLISTFLLRQRDIFCVMGSPHCSLHDVSNLQLLVQLDFLKRQRGKPHSWLIIHSDLAHPRNRQGYIPSRRASMTTRRPAKGSIMPTTFHGYVELCCDFGISKLVSIVNVLPIMRRQ